MAGMTRAFGVARLCLAAALLPWLAGCESLLTEGTSTAAGVGGAAISSAVTSNGSITAAIGLGVQSVAASGLGYVERRVHHREQAQIAAAAGPLPVDGIADWHVDHTIPIAPDEHGEVTVSQVLGKAPTLCKEIVFSVDHPAKAEVKRDFYVTTICQDGARWRWAEAEPATARWGGLQ